MLYQDKSLENIDQSNQNYDSVPEDILTVDYDSGSDLQRQLESLENTILDGVKVPLSDLIIVDGAIILDSVDAIKESLPTSLAIAVQVLQQRQQIIQRAVNQANEIVESAEIKSDRIVQESTLLRRVELEANRIKFEAEQECQKMRREAYTEIEQWREMAALEYEEIQKDADEYAQRVLSDLETRLAQMMSVVNNGSQYLEPSASNLKPNNLEPKQSKQEKVSRDISK